MADVQPTRECSIPECQKRAIARGWCGMHYYRWSKHGDPLTLAPRRRETETCEAPDCDRATPQSRYCSMHIQRLIRAGSLHVTPPRMRLSHSQGYVRIKAEGHPTADARGWAYEHRVALYAAIGPGAHACHWCGVTVAWDRSYPRHRDGLVVDHIDEDKANNDPSNLVPSCSVCNFQRSSQWVKRRKASL